MGRRFADVNGDGLQDFIIGFLDNGSATRRCYLNRGNGFDTASSENWKPPTAFASRGSGSLGRHFENLDGDTAIDLCYHELLPGGTSRKAAYRSRARGIDLMTGIRDGFGAVTTIVHTSLAENMVWDNGAPLYTKGPNPGEAAAIYPEVDIQPPLWVVSSLTIGAQTTTYQYGGMRYDQRREANLGFGWIESQAEATGIRTETTYLQSFPYTGLIRSSRKTYPGVVLSSTDNTWVVQHAGRLYFPFLQASTVTVRDLNGAEVSTATTRENQFDSFGNLLHSVVDSGRLCQDADTSV